MSNKPSAHIFVDNSNIFGGAQRAANTLEQEAVFLSVRLHYRNFFSLIEHGFEAKTRVLAGSVPPGNDDLWKWAKQAGYDTDLLNKIGNDNGRLVEQGVDELLHLKIANALLDFESPQTLVLATGDGKDGQFQTSFTKQIERALARRWNVIVWSWTEQLSGRFKAIPVPPGQSVDIKPLDPFYKQVTFTQAGKYNVGTSLVTVQGRVVSSLKLHS